MMAGAEFVRGSPSSFGAAVLKMPRKTWRQRCKNTLSAFCANIWGEVHSGLRSLARRKRDTTRIPTRSDAIRQVSETCSERTSPARSFGIGSHLVQEQRHVKRKSCIQRFFGQRHPKGEEILWANTWAGGIRI